MKKYKPKYGLSSEEVVDGFINMNKSWFSSITNSFYGKRETVRSFLMVWANTGKFGDDYDDHVLIITETKFEEFLRLNYDEVDQ